MKASDIPILAQLVDAANGWRTTAFNVGVEINLITTQIHDENVTLAWDETDGLWLISMP